jgi:hypothetical protein
MKIYSLLLLSVLTFIAVAQDHAAHAKTTNPAWEKMKTLIGTWDSKAGGPGASITYRLVSDGTALMETTHYGNIDMITMYAPDGDAIAMTHYCAGGNQPRLRAQGLAGDEVHFEFVDAGNVRSPKSEVMRDLRIKFIDGEHVQEYWTSRGAGKDTEMKFELTRAKS